MRLFRRKTDRSPDHHVVSAMLPTLVIDGNEGRIKEVNQRFADLTGWTKEELKDAPLDLLVPTRSRTQHKVDRIEYMKNPTPRPMGPDREVMMLCKDGSEIRVWVSLAPINGVVSCVLYMDAERPGPINPGTH